ncbi:hypothetical protein ACOMHN_067033 [Nucella lapillus]
MLNHSTTLAQIQEMDKRGQLRRRLTKAVLKDTVTVPDGGYTIIRFKADNPGFWLMHCHIEFHNNIGMSLVIQVGEPNQFPPRPKNFPTCGSWKLSIDDDDGHKGSKTNGASATTSGVVTVVLWVLVLGCVGTRPVCSICIFR